MGATVAAALGIAVGDKIEPTHGTESRGGAHHTPQMWTVVGIASPTDSARDSLVWINLESFLSVDDHRNGRIAETGEAGISAVWVYPKAGVHKALLLGDLNKYSQLQVADVATEVEGLLTLVGSANQLLLLVACLVVAVGVSSVALGVYGTVTARRRELSLLRVLGAKRRTVVALVIGEAALLTALGGLLGLVWGHAAVALAADFLRAKVSLRPAADQWIVGEWGALFAIVLAGAMGGLLPALRAYREDAVAGLNSVV